MEMTSSVSGLWHDLWPNLMAEGIGIIVTVFLVDRLINWRETKREQRRWGRTRDATLRRIHTVTNELLIDGLQVWNDAPPIKMWYGTTAVMGMVFGDEKSARECVARAKERWKTASPAGDIPARYSTMMLEVQRIGRELVALLDRRHPLVSADVISHMVELEEAIYMSQLCDDAEFLCVEQKVNGLFNVVGFKAALLMLCLERDRQVEAKRLGTKWNETYQIPELLEKFGVNDSQP